MPPLLGCAISATGLRVKLLAVDALEPHDLTIPESTATVRRVLSLALRRLARDFASLPRHRSLDPVRRVLLDELSREPGRAFAVLRRANVGALVRTIRDAPSRIDELGPTLAATIALELDHSGAEIAFTIEDSPDRVVCLGGRAVLPGGGEARLRFHIWRASRGSYDLENVDSLERPFHEIAGPIVLSLADDNPLAMNEAHPDKRGNAVDLGGRSIDEWLASLRDALAIIGDYLPTLREEMEIVVQQIIPVGFDEQKHLSASYQESIGTIYLTLHPSVMTMTEALIHEFSHNKLNAMFELDPLLTNAFSPLFTSPVRPDPRPLHGILLAVHAFLPVAELYRRMIAAGDARARPERFAQIVKGNREGAEVLLENALPTRAGAAILREIRRLDASFH